MAAIVPPAGTVIEKKPSAGKKRTVDKWKKKTWYSVFAPKEFDRKEIGTTVAEKPQMLLGRRIEVSARNLSGDAKRQHMMLVFIVNDVKGNKAYTQAVGHEVKESYLRKFVRRRNSKIEVVMTVEAKDKTKVKVKSMVLTGRKLQRNKKTDLRKIMNTILSNNAKNFDSQTLVSELVFGTLAQKIYNEAKKVALVKRVEITKSRVLSQK